MAAIDVKHVIVLPVTNIRAKRLSMKKQLPALCLSLHLCCSHVAVITGGSGIRGEKKPTGQHVLSLQPYGDLNSDKRSSRSFMFFVDGFRQA